MAKGSDMNEMIKVEEGGDLFIGGSEGTAIWFVAKSDSNEW